jgi:hypothetical protein
MKASIERSFRKMKDEVIATQFPKQYQGGDRKEAVKLSLNMTPLALKESLPAASVWESFKDRIYTDYIRRPNQRKFGKIAQKYGCKANIEDIFMLFKSKANKVYPLENEPYLQYYFSSNDEKHRRKVNHFGQIDITHNGIQHNYNLKEIDYKMMGREVCIVPDRCDPRYAFIYLEHNEKRFDERTPEEGTIHLLGIGEDAFVRSVDDYINIHKRKQNQKFQEKYICEGIGNHQWAKWENLSGKRLELTLIQSQEETQTLQDAKDERDDADELSEVPSVIVPGGEMHKETQTLQDAKDERDDADELSEVPSVIVPWGEIHSPELRALIENL